MSDVLLNQVAAIMRALPANTPAYTETAFQNAIAGALLNKLPGHVIKRELVLGPNDRPDFGLVMDDHRWLAVEAKIKGSTTEIERQLARYAQHRDIGAVLLVSTRTRHGAITATTMNGKPVQVVIIAAQVFA